MNLFKSSILKFLIFASFIVGCSNVNSKPTIEDYAALSAVSYMRLSTDGEQIAFIKRVKDKKTIIVYALKDKKIISAVNLTA